MPQEHPQAWEECTTPSLCMIMFLLQSLECSLHKPYEINVRAFQGLFLNVGKGFEGISSAASVKFHNVSY